MTIRKMRIVKALITIGALIFIAAIVISITSYVDKYGTGLFGNKTTFEEASDAVLSDLNSYNSIVEIISHNTKDIETVEILRSRRGAICRKASFSEDKKNEKFFFG